SPVAVAVAVVIKRPRVRSGDADTFGIPNLRARLVRALRAEVVDVAAQHVPLHVEIDFRMARIGSENHLEAIVLRDVAVVLGVPRGDVRVFADMADIEVLVIPEELGNRPFSAPLLVPGEMKLTDVPRGEPRRLIQLAVDLDRRSRALDLVNRRLECR